MHCDIYVWEMNTNISGEILLPFQGHLNPEDVDIWNLHWLTLLIGTHFTNRNAKSCVSFGTKRTCTQGKQVFTLWLQVTNWLLQTSSTSIVSSGSTWFWMRPRPWRAQTGNIVTGILPVIGVYSGLLASSSSSFHHFCVVRDDGQKNLQSLLPPAISYHSSDYVLIHIVLDHFLCFSPLNLNYNSLLGILILSIF